MSRYLLDARALQDGSAMRGIGTYVRGLLSGLAALGATAEVGLLLGDGASLPDEVTRGGFAAHPVRLRATNRHLRPLLDPLLVGRALRTEPPAAYHAVEYAQPLRPHLPVVLTVHDLVPFVMPREYPWMRRERYLAMRQFRHADAVIAVSRSTASDLRRISGVDPARITVIHEGVGPAMAIPPTRLAEARAHMRLPDRFVLAVGTFDPRKRVDLLAEVVRRLRLHHDVGLVVAGYQGNFAAAVEVSLGRAGVREVTRVLGHVGGEQLAALYQSAECLLFTSAYEGFGLPPLEAMAAGLPVAVFDNSSLAEVVGDAGVLVKDADVAAMSDAVLRLLSDPGERERRAAMGRRRAAGFTWERAARETLTVYRRVSGQS